MILWNQPNEQNRLALAVTKFTSSTPIQVGEYMNNEGGWDGDSVPALLQHYFIAINDVFQAFQSAEFTCQRLPQFYVIINTTGSQYCKQSTESNNLQNQVP